MKLVRSNDIPYIPASHEDPQNPGVWKKVLFKKEDLLKGNVQMINAAKLPAGHSFNRHYHEEMEEVFIITKGRVTMKVGEEEFELHAGDAVSVPLNTIHEMNNPTDKDVEYLVVGISLGKNGKTVNV